MKNGTKLDYLLFLAEKGAIEEPLVTSTTSLALHMRLSQQTVSRNLLNLRSNEYIDYAADISGCSIMLRDEGIEVLKSYYKRLDSVRKKNLRK